MFLPFHKIKTPNPKFQISNRSLGIGHWSLKKGFTLIELLVARHPKLYEPETLRVERPWRRKATLGFTLIELLVVITIIGIILAAATVSYTNAQQKGRDGRRKADLKAIQQALELYFQTTGTYPGVNSGGQGVACIPPYVIEGIFWGAEFTCTDVDGLKMVYMSRLPTDPLYQSSSNNYYFQRTGTGYTLSATLENSNDPEYCTSSCTSGNPPKLPCQPASGRSYCVINP